MDGSSHQQLGAAFAMIALRRSRRFRFSLKAVFALLFATSIYAWYASGHMPGTLYFHDSGFPHGSGRKAYYYATGALKLEECYTAGQLQKSRWHRPDGTLLHETKWIAGSGVGYYLRDNGTVKSKIEHVNGLAHGDAVYYDEQDKIERITPYREGVQVKP